jgi:flavorubredoxin
MDTSTHEIADGIFRFSTVVAEIAPPAGFTFNQFLVTGEEPLLFHTGPRMMFPLVAAAVARVVPLPRVRWISFGHVESDECGAMNQWLAAAPSAEVVYNRLGCQVSLDDLADRAPRPVNDGDVIDIGGRQLRVVETPHVPHGWEAQVLHEEVTGTLLCGDLFTQVGTAGPITTDDVVGAAVATEDMFHASSLHPSTANTLRRLARLQPARLALMHGPVFEGNAADALYRLADHFAARLSRAA